ncbi:MAG: hypothetical protein LBU62_07645, partial [Bacteroidales bacterium]|nr:hypothetical protein [Bacteroidales bacterium]
FVPQGQPFINRMLQHTVMRDDYSQVPQGRHKKTTKCSPCGTSAQRVLCPVRRLKSTVNKVLSLRDKTPQISTLRI